MGSPLTLSRDSRPAPRRAPQHERPRRSSPPTRRARVLGAPAAGRSSARRTASATEPRAAQPPRHPHAAAGPVHARGGLVHVARRRHGDDHAARGERAGHGPVAPMADDHVAARHDRARRRPTRPAARWRARRPVRRAGGRSAPRARGRELIGQAGERGAQQAMLGILRGRRRDEHDRSRAGRRLDLHIGRQLPQQRPDHVRRRPRRPWVLELRERRDEAQRARDPAVHVGQRRQPELPARLG